MRRTSVYAVHVKAKRALVTSLASVVSKEVKKSVTLYSQEVKPTRAAFTAFWSCPLAHETASPVSYSKGSVGTAKSSVNSKPTCFSIIHLHHQSLNRQGRWSTTDDFATSFFFFFLHFSSKTATNFVLLKKRPPLSLSLKPSLGISCVIVTNPYRGQPLTSDHFCRIFRVPLQHGSHCICEPVLSGKSRDKNTGWF